jgi:hypothetical protein
MVQTTMSFLDVQDLATVAAQGGFFRALAQWCFGSRHLLGVLEGAALAGLVAALLRRR